MKTTTDYAMNIVQTIVWLSEKDSRIAYNRGAETPQLKVELWTSTSANKHRLSWRRSVNDLWTLVDAEMFRGLRYDGWLPFDVQMIVDLKRAIAEVQDSNGEYAQRMREHLRALMEEK